MGLTMENEDQEVKSDLKKKPTKKTRERRKAFRDWLPSPP